MLNKRAANKLIPDVLSKNIKNTKMDKMETGQLIVKDGAIWNLQNASSTLNSNNDTEKIEFNDPDWRHDDQYKFKKDSRKMVEHLFDV